MMGEAGLVDEVEKSEGKGSSSAGKRERMLELKLWNEVGWGMVIIYREREVRMEKFACCRIGKLVMQQADMLKE